MNTMTLSTPQGKMALGDFETARRTRLKSGIAPRGGSADSHRDIYTLDQIRRETQSLHRNDQLARSLVARTVQFVVGEEVRLQIKSSDKAFNAAAEKFLKVWTKGCDHRGHIGPDGRRTGRGLTEICRMSVTAGLVDGDLLVIPTSDGYAQLIEAERLVNPDGATMPKVLPNGNTAVGGFEYDRFDRPVAVHIAEWGVQGQQRKTTTSRVAIGSVLHLAIPVDDTINLTRPEPGLSVLVRHFDQLRNYIGDVATAAQVATLFGLVTKTSQPQQFALELAGSSVQKTNAANSAYTQRETELEPGMMAHLNPGEDIVQIKPEQPTTQFGDYTRSNLSMMGASVGVPLCLWLLDFERVNFASARSALLVAYCGFFVWRNWLTDRLIRPLVRWRLEMAIRRGEIPGYALGSGRVPEDWGEVEVFFPPMPVLEPLAQYQAEAFAIDKKIKTHREVLTSLGRDYDETVLEMAEERKTSQDLGILPVGTPGQLDPNIDRGKQDDAAPQ